MRPVKRGLPMFSHWEDMEMPMAKNKLAYFLSYASPYSCKRSFPSVGVCVGLWLKIFHLLPLTYSAAILQQVAISHSFESGFINVTKITLQGLGAVFWVEMIITKQKINIGSLPSIFGRVLLRKPPAVLSIDHIRCNTVK